MKDIKIKINSKNSMVYPDNDIAGINYENVEGNIICYFDEFIDGVAWLEVKFPDNTKGYLSMTKVEETYVLPIKSSLLAQVGIINMQLRITQSEIASEIPVFKSNIFYLKVKEAINSTTTVPSQYPSWIDIANAKILEINEAIDEVENLDITSQRVADGVEITFTDKEGTETVRKVNDGATGSQGPKGDTGEKGEKGDTGAGVPTGGTTGQILKKKSNTNYDTEWSNLDLSIYSLITETGNKIDLSIDSSTYVMTLSLKDKNNNVLSTGSIDLPLETMVVGATYDNVNKKIILTLKNGQTIDVPVGDLVNGLATQTALNEEITNRQNADNLKENIFRYSAMPTADSSNVNKIAQYIGETGTYTNGYFYKCVHNSIQESITATQTDNVVPLGTITVNNNEFKSQVNAGTHEFVYRPYDTVLNFSNISVFPPVMIQVTRESTFDRQPMIPNAPRMYGWVDNSNNFYVTNTLQPNALTKLYSYDIQTNEATDTGATFISSNTPSLIEGRWTKKEGDVYTDVELSDYGIYLSSAGLPGNKISVTYVEANETYEWQQVNVQPSGGTTDGANKDLSNLSSTGESHFVKPNDNISSLNNDAGYVTNAYHDNTKQNTIDSSNKLSSDLVDDTGNTHKFVTASEKTNWNNKANTNNPVLTGWLLNGYNASMPVGANAFGFGNAVKPCGDYSFAEGSNTQTGQLDQVYCYIGANGTTLYGSLELHKYDSYDHNIAFSGSVEGRTYFYNVEYTETPTWKRWKNAFYFRVPDSFISGTVTEEIEIEIECYVLGSGIKLEFNGGNISQIINTPSNNWTTVKYTIQPTDNISFNGSFGDNDDFRIYGNGCQVRIHGIRIKKKVHTNQSGLYAHAENNTTEAVGRYSHTSGFHTKSTSDAQFVIGRWNKTDDYGYQEGFTGNAFIIGNGTNQKPSNAVEVDWSGNMNVLGSIIGDTVKDKNGKTLVGFGSHIMGQNNSVELTPGMFFLFPGGANMSITGKGRRTLYDLEEDFTITSQDTCGGICTQLGEAEENNGTKNSDYWRLFVGYRSGTLSFDSKTYYIHKDNVVTATKTNSGTGWEYFIKK